MQSRKGRKHEGCVTDKGSRCAERDSRQNVIQAMVRRSRISAEARSNILQAIIYGDSVQANPKQQNGHVKAAEYRDAYSEGAQNADSYCEQSQPYRPDRAEYDQDQNDRPDERNDAEASCFGSRALRAGLRVEYRADAQDLQMRHFGLQASFGRIE